MAGNINDLFGLCLNEYFEDGRMASFARRIENHRSLTGVVSIHQILDMGFSRSFNECSIFMPHGFRVFSCCFDRSLVYLHSGETLHFVRQGKAEETYPAVGIDQMLDTGGMKPLGHRLNHLRELVEIDLKKGIWR